MTLAETCVTRCRDLKAWTRVQCGDERAAPALGLGLRPDRPPASATLHPVAIARHAT